MNGWHRIFLIICLFSFVLGCAGNPDKIEIPKDAAEMKVSFSWHGIKSCTHDSPEIQVANVPEGTVELRVKLKNKSVPNWNQGGGVVDHDGSGLIPAGYLDIGYNGPCPLNGRNKYEFSVMAVDAEGAIVGFGKAMQPFPPTK